MNVGCIQPIWPMPTSTPGTEAIAEYALCRLPPPPRAAAADAWAELTLYMSPPTPDFTSDAPACDVTRTIVLSFFGSVRTTCWV